MIDQVPGRGDTQDTFREAPRCGGGAPEYIVPGGPDAAWAIGDIYCGSLTGDSGGAGRRPRLTWTETVKPSGRRADRERTTSSSRGLTAIILRLRWSSVAACHACVQAATFFQASLVLPFGTA